METLEHEAHGLAETAPFQGDVVEFDPELAAGGIQSLGDARLQEVEVNGPGHQPHRSHGHEHRDRDDDDDHDAFEQPISSSHQCRYFH